MGREAVCRCNWAGEEAEVKVLLEGPELILRGGLRRKVPVASVAGIAADGGKLTFLVGGDEVALHLGEQQAARWARALLAPQPTLAGKLGINGQSRILVLGSLSGPELEAAVGQAASVHYLSWPGDTRQEPAGQQFNFVLACVRRLGELEDAAAFCVREVPHGVPVWIVYAKGAGKPVTETDVRATLLADGFVDSKVASVSATHTGFKFTRRKGAR
jgi:hypothetical protein